MNFLYKHLYQDPSFGCLSNMRPEMLRLINLIRMANQYERVMNIHHEDELADVLQGMVGFPSIEQGVERTLHMLYQPDDTDPEPWPDSSDENAYFEELHQHDP